MDLPKTLFSTDYQHIYGVKFLARAVQAHYRTRFSTVVLGGNPSLVSLVRSYVFVFYEIMYLIFGIR